MAHEIPTQTLIAWRAGLAARLSVPPREEGHEERQDGSDAPTTAVGDRRSQIGASRAAGRAAAVEDWPARSQTRRLGLAYDGLKARRP